MIEEPIVTNSDECWTRTIKATSITGQLWIEKGESTIPVCNESSTSTLLESTTCLNGLLIWLKQFFLDVSDQRSDWFLFWPAGKETGRPNLTQGHHFVMIPFTAHQSIHLTNSGCFSQFFGTPVNKFMHFHPKNMKVG